MCLNWKKGSGSRILTQFCGVDAGNRRKPVFGEVPERLNGADSKSVVRVTESGVRIPPSPPKNGSIKLFLCIIGFVEVEWSKN